MSASVRPNVVLFMLDTLRADYCSCYGHAAPTTPEIDRLAAEGAVFLDNVSPAIWTLPSVASMMTGLYPHSHGAGAHNDSFDERHTTIAETLAARGYRTMAFYANAYCEMSKKGFRETHRPPDRPYSVEKQHDLSRDRVQRAIEWLDRNPPSDGSPFFLFVQLMDAHLPLHPPPEFAHFTLADATAQEIAAIDQNPLEVWAGRNPLTDRQYAILRSMLDGEAAFADSLVGRLAEAMRSRDLLDDTIFIVTSDHGDMLGERHTNEGAHDHFTHHLCLYEELIKTPLVIRYPRAFAPGTRVERSSQTLDIFPTLGELIGFETPFCQGHSLAAAAAGRSTRSFTLTEYMKSTHVAARLLARIDPKKDVRLYLRWLKAFRKNGMKYIWTSDRRDELFDLRQDPGEQRNLIAAMPQAADAMRIEMEDYLASLPCGWRGDAVITGNCPKECIDRLRGLEFFHDMA